MCVCVYVSVCACAREVRVVCCGLLWLVEVAHALLPSCLFLSLFRAAPVILYIPFVAAFVLTGCLLGVWLVIILLVLSISIFLCFHSNCPAVLFFLTVLAYSAVIYCPI